MLRSSSEPSPALLTPGSDASVAATASRARLRIAAVLVSGAVIAGTVLPADPALAADTSAPSTPGSLSAEYSGGVGTVVAWGKVSASDLAGYRVYRSATKTMTADAASRVATTTSLTATDAAIAGGSTGYYAVTAYDRTGNESKPSSVKQVQAKDTRAPDAPSSVKATASASGVALDWADSDEVDLRGYVVARSTSSSGTDTTLTASPVTTSAFTDAQAPGGITSYYRITAVDLTGNASSAATASAKRPAGAPTAPAAPGSLTAKLGSTGGVALSWSASTGATSYVVARGTSAAT
jgi:fibronectin type 3 domain-containing protein